MDNKLIEEVNNNDFFHDFILFLKRLEEKPIKRTVTGNISLIDITDLQKGFRQQKIFNEYKKYGWKIRTESEIDFLTQIKVIAEVMHLTYKRKNKIFLSKNGKGYLYNIDSITQHCNMVLDYWEGINWEYFSYSPEINGISAMEILQKNQYILWNAFLKKQDQWFEFKLFCQTIMTHFKLSDYYKNLYDLSFYLNIEYGLLRKNLVRFGCIECEERKDKHNISRIVRIRPTNLGLFIFERAIGRFI